MASEWMLEADKTGPKSFLLRTAMGPSLGTSPPYPGSPQLVSGNDHGIHTRGLLWHGWQGVPPVCGESLAHAKRIGCLLLLANQDRHDHAKRRGPEFQPTYSVIPPGATRLQDDDAGQLASWSRLGKGSMATLPMDCHYTASLREHCPSVPHLGSWGGRSRC